MMIRPMTEDDISQVAMLEKAVFSDPWSEKVYRETFAQPGVAYVVTVITDEFLSEHIIGAAGVRNICGVGEITNVMIADEYRRSGYGEHMLRTLLETGRQIGANDFTLEVRASNEPARKLYEKLGFISEGLRPGYYEHPAEDAVIMWKRDSND